FFVFDDGSIATPPLSGTILPGITRDSLLTMARDTGREVREEAYAIDQAQADAASGRLVEAFACGTAAVVTPIGAITVGGTRFAIGDGQPGRVTAALRAALVALQLGEAADPYGWHMRID
ncbi:MAG: branched chain amino acid aminotransferase, partial [Sphingobium sp.]|nr:branched chain amino acid aminotransferase [Sphingobium sp.]